MHLFHLLLLSAKLNLKQQKPLPLLGLDGPACHFKHTPMCVLHQI